MLRGIAGGRVSGDLSLVIDGLRAAIGPKSTTAERPQIRHHAIAVNKGMRRRGSARDFRLPDDLPEIVDAVSVSIGTP